MLLSIKKISYKIIVLATVISVVFGKYLYNDVIGIPYYHEGGFPLFKIHLYSYLIILGFLVCLLSNGFRIKLLRFRSLVFLFLCILYIMLFGVIKNGLSGLAYVVDSIFTPLLAAAILLQFSEEQRGKLAKIIIFLICINSFIAIVEYFLGYNFLPRAQAVYEFRAWALLGHPLNNTLITSFCIFLIYLSRPLEKSLLVVFLGILALLAFGGRAGFVITFLFFIIHFFNKAYDVARNNDYIYKNSFIITVLITPFILFFAFLSVDYGFGERIFDNLYLDDSAETRLRVFNLFDYISTRELFWGVDSDFYLLVPQVTGVEAIENAWLAWLFQFGVVNFVLLVTFFVFFLYRWTKFNSSSILGLALFILICSSNNSLATKTPALLIFILAIFAFPIRKVHAK